MSQDHLLEQTVTSERVYQGEFLEVRRDQARLADGSLHPREWVVHPGAAAILALDDDGRVLLVRQYRYAMRQTYDELPAGKIDPGETPLQAAQRELWEETGYVAREWAFLTQIHPAIGFCNERLDLFLARGLVLRAGGKPDAGEVLEVVWQKPLALLDAIRRGALPDVKTQIALLHWYQLHQGAWPWPSWHETLGLDSVSGSKGPAVSSLDG